MSLAPASSRGFFLNARFAVNGIQCAARSFGTATGVGLGLLSSMGGLFSVWGDSYRQTISFVPERERQHAVIFPRNIPDQRSAAAIQNTSPSESAVSSQSSGSCG